jgi:hypothetical protein
VTPAPRYAHQEVVARLLVALRLYLARSAGVGHAMLSPADISFGLPDVLVQPDVFVLAPRRRGGRSGARSRGCCSPSRS